MKSLSIFRVLALSATVLLCGAASCEKEDSDQNAPTTVQVVDNGQPVQIAVRYTVVGFEAGESNLNLAVGTKAYRACYSGTCPGGARKLLDREAVPTGVYTLDLGKARPDTTHLFVAAWSRYTRKYPLKAGASIKAEVLANNEVVKTLTLSAADQLTSANYVNEEELADLIKEIEVSWPK